MTSRLVVLALTLFCCVTAAAAWQNEVNAAIELSESTLSIYKDSSKVWNEKISEISSMVSTQDLDVAQSKLAVSAEEIHQLLGKANKKQLHGLLDELQALKQQYAMEQVIIEPDESTVVVNVDGVTTDKISRKFDEVIKEHFTKIDTVLTGIVTDALEELPPLAPEDEEDYVNDDSAIATADEQCLATAQAAQIVHTTVSNRHGPEDAAQGGVIIHELTSNTYSGLSKSQLGQVWWSRYIPDDIEQFLLPKSWRSWNVQLPAVIQHTLGWYSSSKSSLPPSAILSHHNLPKSCWHMSGSKGQVTFTLPHPVFVDAITINHVDQSMLSNVVEQITCAPKKISIVGYHKCDIGDDCGGYMFDMNKPINLVDFQYEISGPSMQTFVISDYQNDSEASCGVDADSTAAASASCSAPPDDDDNEPVSAIQLQISSNWGNADYTCLYNVRIHGEIVA